MVTHWESQPEAAMQQAEVLTDPNPYHLDTKMKTVNSRGKYSQNYLDHRTFSSGMQMVMKILSKRAHTRSNC